MPSAFALKQTLIEVVNATAARTIKPVRELYDALSTLSAGLQSAKSADKDVAELRYGADRRGSAKLHALIDAFVGAVSVQPFGALEASRYGKLSANLASVGTPIGQFDTLIAAHALTLGLTLVTSNTRHFSAVSELRIVDWF